MNITLPRLFRNDYLVSVSKNRITQLLSLEQQIELDIVEEGENFVVIENAGISYLCTNEKDFISDKYDYVLLTNNKPNNKKLVEGKTKIKSWLHHPKLITHTPKDVISSWKNQFSFKEEESEPYEPGLRQPQIAALHSIMGHLKLPLDTATVVMPTGTGKTETMLSTLIANRCLKLLVTVPSDSLRDQISNKFYTLGLLKQFEVVLEEALYPIVGIIRNKFDDIDTLVSFFEKSNVIVTTMSWLTGQTPEIQEKIAGLCSHIFIDEAHHVKANSWNEFKNKFPKEKVIQFTATPFRNDGKRLDGKIISNFPLRIAQQQGYYKTINFIPVREYDTEKADQKIAEVSIAKLDDDREKGFNHILMARCSTKARAEEVYKLYQHRKDLNPVVIYSGVTNFKEIYQKIITRTAKVIICVDMLGEGFDLPELKIAAFHDIRRSLPITLQLAGRFTRTKFDEELGEASFVANISDLDVRSELSDLYAADADWNTILSDISSDRVDDEIAFKDFMDGFSKLSDSNIPFRNISPKLSTVVYKNKTENWFPLNFEEGLPGYEDFDFKFSDINRNEKVLVIVTGKTLEVEWINHKAIHDVQWDIIIVFWDTINNLLFINSSDNSSLYYELAQAIIGEDAELIRGINVFRSFYNIKRVKLQNVGLRQFLGKNIRFRMMVGSDVAEALSLAERQRGEKAFVMGTGYEEGNPVNIGASYKGRIWTKLKGDLKDFTTWCYTIGEKLINEEIDPNQILKETLIPTLVSSVPDVFPVWIDWDVDIYLDTETKFKFFIDGIRYDLSTIDLCIVNPASGGPIDFALTAETNRADFRLELFENTTTENSYPDFRVIKISELSVEVHYGSKRVSGEEFFMNFIPTVWFADGSALTGNEYVELKQSIKVYPRENIIAWDWSGVNIRNESQHVNPLITDSIQYNVIERLKTDDFDIVYDDDYSGEIADIVAIKIEEKKVLIKLYHLKYALDGVVSNQIKNFYEVCGQAQKSIHWKHKSGSEFINHMLRRVEKSKNGFTRSRIEKGDQSLLVKLLSILKNEIPVEFEIFIVQPGFSKAVASDEILTLLGVTETYIKEFSDINLKVISSN